MKAAAKLKDHDDDTRSRRMMDWQDAD